MTASKRANRVDGSGRKKPAARTGKTRATPVPLRTGPKRADGEEKGGSKRALLIERISRPEGAQIDELTKELGWLPHTVRAALTGLRRKGYVIAREKVAGEPRSIGPLRLQRRTVPLPKRRARGCGLRRSARPDESAKQRHRPCGYQLLHGTLRSRPRSRHCPISASMSSGGSGKRSTAILHRRPSGASCSPGESPMSGRQGGMAACLLLCAAGCNVQPTI